MTVFIIVPFIYGERSVDFHAPPELLVLVADELDELVVRRDLLIDAQRQRFRVRLRIVERDVDFQLAVAGPANALGELRPVGIRAAADVEPPVIRARLGSPQVVRVDDKRVAFPASDRVAVPEWLYAALSGQRTSVGINVPKA